MSDRAAPSVHTHKHLLGDTCQGGCDRCYITGMFAMSSKINTISVKDCQNDLYSLSETLQKTKKQNSLDQAKSK